MSEQETLTDLDRSWSEARHIVSLVGEPPRFLTATIHFLMKDSRDNHGKVSPITAAFLTRLLKSHSFLATLYHATEVFHGEELKNRKDLQPIDLCSFYATADLATLLAFVYLYRRIKKGCPKNEFHELCQQLIPRSTVGGCLGNAIPSIGFSVGFAVGALPWLGKAMLLGIDTKSYLALQQDLRRGKVENELKAEEEKWECNHLQIGILLFKVLGAGASLYDPIMAGLSAPELSKVEGKRDAYRARLSEVWISSLIETGQAPQMIHKGEFYPMAEELKDLLSSVSMIKGKSLETSWIHSTRKELTPEKAPQLCSEITLQKDSDIEPPLEDEPSLDQLDTNSSSETD